MNKRYLIRVCRFLALAKVLFMVTGVWAAGPWYVATNGVDSNAGTSWDAAFLTISNALANASLNDTIWVSNGVYVISAMVSNPATKTCQIRAASTNPANTVLLGPGSNATTHATGGFRGVWMDGAGSLLEGFTVTNFYTTNENLGAGAVCWRGGVISNCIITGNIMNYPGAGWGAGVYLYDLSARVENCDFIGNRVMSSGEGGGGGGVTTIYGSIIKNCRIVGNTSAARAGGVWMFGRDTLRDSIVASNTSSGKAGGIYFRGTNISNCHVFDNISGDYAGGLTFVADAPLSSTNLTIEGCVFSNNYGVEGGISDINNLDGNVLISRCTIINNRSGSGRGAGLRVVMKPGSAYSILNIRNCLVANNIAEGTTAGRAGAGMSVEVTNALIENCTVASNTTYATAYGAGLYITNAVRIVNSIIYHNSGGVAGTSNVYASADCTFSNCCAAPLPAAGSANTDADPQFVAKDIGNFRLSAFSPCVNAGANQSWMTNVVDLDGRIRIRYGTVDIGAYETIYEGTIYRFGF